MATILPHTTRATGTVLTAAIYNGDHQVHITNANSLNTQLIGIADIAIVTGLVVSNGSNSITGVTLAGTANEVTVTNGNGLGGNPTISLPAAMTLGTKTISGGIFSTFKAVDTMYLSSTDAGATEGPIMTLHRDSASPLAADLLGALNFDGEDSGSVQTTYAKIFATLVDPVNATEDGTLTAQIMLAGTLTNRLVLAAAGNVINGNTTVNGTITVTG